ncbi:hypothetical protein [Rickettsia helvetica]|uniref:hypothetical protein n=1 Tax=Rickettsia helvetica TaxID=35789 RepID=UPI000493BB63|nr:hypothetical protein [Rickettsia helvetica]MCZ6884165.1 hypothetical protein [Rickettsia endosymbiont of Ixodes ricinus]MCZ6896144.1 hypothetical protein [Rickettsia endosymbiont of Ixodes ricinus]
MVLPVPGGPLTAKSFSDEGNIELIAAACKAAKVFFGEEGQRLSCISFGCSKRLKASKSSKISIEFGLLSNPKYLEIAESLVIFFTFFLSEFRGLRKKLLNISKDGADNEELVFSTLFTSSAFVSLSFSSLSFALFSSGFFFFDAITLLTQISERSIKYFDLIFNDATKKSIIQLIISKSSCTYPSFITLP